MTKKELLWSPEIVTGAPRIDYWRTSSWHRPETDRWALFDDAPKKKFQQYVMADFGDVRLGYGKQRHPLDRNIWTHYIAESSGSIAHQTFGRFQGEKCIRLDVQVTLPAPHDTPRKLFHQLTPKRVWIHGRVRGVRIIANHDKMDTCYIGSRASDRVIRVYSKGRPDAELVRFEVEYKGKRADNAAMALYAEEIDVGDLVVGEIKMLPPVPALKPFTDWAENRSAWVPEVERGQPSDWWVWFHRTCWPALVKGLNDHDYGRQLQNDVADLLREIDNREQTG